MPYSARGARAYSWGRVFDCLQAKLQDRNNRFERYHEAFREEVESTLEVVEEVATRNFKKGQEVWDITHLVWWSVFLQRDLQGTSGDSHPFG